MSETINLKLKVWRQNGPDAKGHLETYEAESISTDMSFLEMLDVVNEKLTLEGKQPVAFDHDCREGICGSCGAMVNGIAHGPERGTTLCQLHMRHFKDGDTLVIEPFRARAFKVVKDLVLDRSAFDKIIQAGGYISANTGEPLTATQFPYRLKRLNLPWMLPPALVVGPVWQRARMLRPCFLLGPRFLIWHFCPRETLKQLHGHCPC